ncbi:hypothetical protein ACFVUS_06035 [Nocardia sp. NPDC058058]|uniref:hypothetical protein n=1 Tax=Nocardia sp. NPDC058058 TaxID=3346317 RepID=UPI0036DA87F7
MGISRITEAVERGKQDRETVAFTVEMVRRSAKVVPGLDPTLAGLLRLLAKRLSEQGQHEQALAAVDESVRIARREKATWSARFDIQLVWSLAVRADILDSLGRGREAVAAGREAVASCRYGLSDEPRLFGPALVVALDTVARSLGDIGEPLEALEFGEELVQILRRLTTRRPQYDRALGAALHQNGVYFAGAGQHADALRATDEAIQVFQRLRDQEPGSYTAQLRVATDNRDIFLNRLAGSGHVILGPYPLCRYCEQTNGGLIAVRHRQIHIRAADRESCVDHKLTDIITTLWNRGCDTRSSCQDENGRAMVTPAAGHADLAVNILADMGIHTDEVDGLVYFTLPPETKS